MRNLILVLMISASIYGFVSSQGGTGKYMCDTDKIVITHIDTSIGDKAELVYAEGQSATCASGLTAGTTNVVFKGKGSTTDPFKADIPTGPDAADRAKCGVSKSGTISKVIIIVQQKASVLKATDYVFTFSCDGTKNVGEQLASVLTVSGNPTVGTVTGDIPLKVGLAKEDTGLPFSGNTGTLGDEAIIRVTMTDISKPVKECKLSAVASKDLSFGETVTLFGKDGCSVTTDGIFLDNKGKFQKFPPRGNSMQYDSSKFKLFRFKDFNTLFIRVSCSGCRAGEDCSVTCPPTGRKRRGVNINNTTASAKTQLFVLAAGERIVATETARSHEERFLNCLNHVTFTSVVAILSLLLLVSLSVSVFFCSKLLRQKEQTHKECYPNPAYKA